MKKSILLSVIGLLGIYQALQLDAAEKPNIIFLFSDDHALQALSSYGGRLKDIAPTPNIDRLAKEGAIFENSFCANSICGPSRATILTGKHSHKNGFKRNGNKYDGSQTTFPKLMQKVGYQTALIGKWHLTSDPQGFDHWEILPGQGHYYNPDLIQMDGTKKRFHGYCTDIVTDHAIKWLDQRDKTKPFILMCQHKAPHRNWSPAQRHLTLFDDQTIPEPKTLRDDYSSRAEWLKKNKMTIEKHFHWRHDMKFHGASVIPEKFLDKMDNEDYDRMTVEQKKAWDAVYEPKNQKFITDYQEGKLSDDDVLKWKYQRYIKDYLRTIRGLDENIGRMLDYIDKSGLAENTIVIYSSDQGFYLGEHGWYDKRWMFEESLKMPFLIRWPGVIQPGIRPQEMIQNIDYAPTFLEIAGINIPEDIQGKSLVPIFKGETPKDWRQDIYYAYYMNPGTHNVPRHDGVRTGRYKIFYLPQANEWQLFDLKEDPMELRSVHEDPAYAGVFLDMQKLYNIRRGQVGGILK